MSGTGTATRALACAIGAVVGVAASGCRQEEASQQNPYVVQVDVGPQIRAFEEETITADEAADQLEQMGPGVIPALAAALAREPKDSRLKSIEVLARIGTPAAVPPLLRAAREDADEDVRADALRALGTIGDERGREVLEAAVADPSVTIRVGGIMGCASVCTSPATIERLADIAVKDADASVARAARKTLTALLGRDPAVASVARQAVERRQPSALPAGATAVERAQAALLFSEIDGAASVPALVAEISRVPPQLHRQIIWRLGTLGDERAAPALAQLLAGPDALAQAYAYDALVKLRDEGVEQAAGSLAAYTGRRPNAPLTPPDS